MTVLPTVDDRGEFTVVVSRAPDPVLQQIEDFNDATLGVTDCFRPVSRWWDRVTRPEQLLTSLPRAMQVLTDPLECGPVTLAMCQDVQAEAFDWPRYHEALVNAVEGLIAV